MKTSVLKKEVQERIADIKEADILVGIPSYNNAATIAHVVRAVNAGLVKYFPDKKCVIINSDGGSTDGTMDVVHGTSIEDFESILISQKTESVLKLATPYHGIPGKGSAFRTIFEIGKLLKVVCYLRLDVEAFKFRKMLLQPEAQFTDQPFFGI